jgi:hypothetical protein
LEVSDGSSKLQAEHCQEYGTLSDIFLQIKTGSLISKDFLFGTGVAALRRYSKM